MKIDKIDNDIVKKFIPNVLLEVEGETPIADKLAPWIRSAKDWIETEFLGPDDFLTDDDNERAIHIIVLKAFADAVPSLDLVVTPTGFGVVNTETVAPASKERVERLLESLRNKIDGELKILLDYCHGYPGWRESERGKYFCSTFLSSLNDCRKSVFASFDDMRGKALQVEALMEEQYLGHELMSCLRDVYNSRVFCPLGDYVHTAVSKVVYHIGEPVRPILWHCCRQIIERLHQFPEYYEIWQNEMGDKFTERFNNDIKGSYFF